MSQAQQQNVDLSALSEDERRDVDALLQGQMWRRGELEWLLDPHQVETLELFDSWNARRQTREYEDAVIASGATLDDVWVDEIGRRFGKTSKWLVVLMAIGIRRPGAVLMYATAFQADIPEIIVPLAEILCQSAPDDVRPVYKASSKGSREGLYFPNKSVIRLVGLDMHPNAARGKFSDGIVLSEAGFMKGLENLIRAVLLPQFQRRPWAFLVCESSTSEDPLHDFQTKIIPDAKLRGAYVKRTIDDNTAISDRERQRHIRMAGGRGHPTCEREYYCDRTRDPEKLVFPEFNPKVHVREWKRPEFAVAITAADPGTQDLFGLVFGYFDFLNAKHVYEKSWARRNASTRQVAAIIAAYEFELWGTIPPHKMRHIPLQSDGDITGWFELLAGDPVQVHAPKLYELAQLGEDMRADEELHPTPGRLQFYDSGYFRPNPFMRFSDIDLRLIADLQTEFGIVFAKTRKDDRDAQINLMRDRYADFKIVHAEKDGPLALHVEGCQWNERRTDFLRHPRFGHYDCASAEMYAERNFDVIERMNPNPPRWRDLNQQMVVFPTSVDEGLPEGLQAFADAFGEERPWR